MEKNKFFLALALTSLIAIAGPTCIDELTTDHTKLICAISRNLQFIGLKDAAINHQVNAINRKDGYSAEYVEDIKIKAYITKEENKINFVKDEVYISNIGISAYDRESDTANAVFIDIEKYIKVESDELLIPYKLELR